MMKVKVSAVIAVYNEAENIIELLQRLMRVFDEIKIEFEIILVIQGKDGSLELVREWGRNYDNLIRVIYREEPLGVGPAFKIGFSRISDDSTHVLTMDADLNHQPEELLNFLGLIEDSEVDIVIGSRYIPGGSMRNVHAWRYLLSKYVNDLLTFVGPIKIKDKTSGYRLQKKEVVLKLRDKIKTKGFDFYIDYLLMAQKAGFSMAEIPITFIGRTKGKSKMGIIDTLFRYCILIIKNYFPFFR